MARKPFTDWMSPGPRPPEPRPRTVGCSPFIHSPEDCSIGWRAIGIRVSDTRKTEHRTRFDIFCSRRIRKEDRTGLTKIMPGRVESPQVVASTAAWWKTGCSHPPIAIQKSASDFRPRNKVLEPRSPELASGEQRGGAATTPGMMRATVQILEPTSRRPSPLGSSRRRQIPGSHAQGSSKVSAPLLLGVQR